jgi:hypothetical protein
MSLDSSFDRSESLTLAPDRAELTTFVEIALDRGAILFLQCIARWNLLSDELKKIKSAATHFDSL